MLVHLFSAQVLLVVCHAFVLFHTGVLFFVLFVSPLTGCYLNFKYVLSLLLNWWPTLFYLCGWICHPRARRRELVLCDHSLGTWNFFCCFSVVVTLFDLCFLEAALYLFSIQRAQQRTDVTWTHNWLLFLALMHGREYCTFSIV